MSPLILAMVFAAQQQPDMCLAFVSKELARGNGNFFTYYKISEQKIVVRQGDVLEYSVLIDPASPLAKAAVDIDFNDGSTLRDSTAVDQNGIRAHGDGVIEQAKGKWYTRRIQLDSFIGKTTDDLTLNFEGDKDGQYAAFFDDISIEHKDGSHDLLYVTGPPSAREVVNAEGYSKEPTVVPVQRSVVDMNVSDALAFAIKQGAKLKVLEKAREDISFAKKFLAQNPDPELEGHIKEAEAMMSKVESSDATSEQIEEVLHQAQHTLSHTHPMMEQYTGHLVGHSHIDLQWLWEWQEGIVTAHDTFNQVLKFMDQYPGFTFSQSSSCLYQTVEEHYPDLFKKIQAKVKSGQWEIVGGRVCEGDTNMLSPESHARHFLYGQRYFREKFGKTAIVGWEPDTFGHTAQMPQILQLGGCKYYYFCRGGKGKPLFWWTALDGTKVLAFDEPASGSWYNSDLSYKQFQEMLDFKTNTGSKDMLWVYGVGNHGGGPTKEEIETALGWMKDPTKPKVQFSTATQFFKKLETYDLAKIPEIQDELNPVFDGCYTTHSEIKQLNREAEANTTSAEALATVASLVAGYRYPKAAFRQNWEDITFNHHHDTLPGSGIHPPYERTKTELGKVLADDKDIVTRAFESLVINVTPKQGGLSVMVYNPTGWARSGWVQSWLVKSGWDGGEGLNLSSAVAEGPLGDQNPVVLVDDRNHLARFWASDIPAFGYKVFWIHNGPGMDRNPHSRDEGYTFENDNMLVEFDRTAGGIKRLLWKASGRELVKPGGLMGRLEVHEENPGGMSAWVLGQIGAVKIPAPKTSLAWEGPDDLNVAYTYEVPDAFGNISKVRQTFHVYKESSQIDCQVDCDWQAVGSGRTQNPMLRVAFDESDDSAQATYEVPFGWLFRKNDGSEWPALEWADIGNADSGVSILNDSKYGYSATGSTMRLSLIRSSFEPDPMPNPGKHTWHYAIRPRAASDFAAITRSAAEFNQPLLMATVPFDARGTNPLVYSPLSLSDERLVPTALKKSEDGDDVILRFYEAAGIQNGSGSLNLGFPAHSVQTVNFIEDPLSPSRQIKGMSVSVNSTKFKIQTLKISRQ